MLKGTFPDDGALFTNGRLHKIIFKIPHKWRLSCREKRNLKLKLCLRGSLRPYEEVTYVTLCLIIRYKSMGGNPRVSLTQYCFLTNYH